MDSAAARSASPVCASHARNYDPNRCPVQPISAETIEAMFVASIARLLLAEETPEPVDESSATGGWTRSLEREALLEAVREGRDDEINPALERLFMQMSPHAAVARQLAVSQRVARQLAAARRLETWLEAELAGRTDETRREIVSLNRLLRSWFLGVWVTVDEVGVDIVAERRPTERQSTSSRAAVHIGLQEWARTAAASGRPYRPWHTWGRADILGSLQSWADTHGRSPRYAEWRLPGRYHPCALTVRNKFGGWAKALSLAGPWPNSPGGRAQRPSLV